MRLVRESLYDDVYYFNVLNEAILNEKINIEKLRNVISKISNKSEILNKFIRKFNETKDFSVKKHLSTILVMLFIMNFVGRNSIFGDITVSNLSKEVAKETVINVNKLKNITKEKAPEIKILKFDYKTAKTSESVKNFIKEHEKLRLSAYAIGDGRITIGYGHAYKEKKSPYNVGDSITKEKAEKLFNSDILKAENGVKRIFSDWEEQGIKLNINQNMFDAMVSMAFNMGVNGLRKSEFIKHLKNEDYKAAAEKIKTTKTTSVIKDNEGNLIRVNMPGLISRRQKENELFTKNL
jgi:lysozyme